MLEAEWAPGACLEDILGLGPRRAEVLLTWMLENAAVVGAGPGIGVDADDASEVDLGAAQLRNAALEGLGALIGGARLPADARERAFASLMRYSTGSDNAAYRRGVADGLSRSRDPRAVDTLERLADTRDDPEVRQAALRGLVVGFHDDKAAKKLRRELDDRDPNVQLRAAQALYETADEKAFKWAVHAITQRRVADSEEPDIRAQVVRDLVELGGDASRATLRDALDAGARNDWVEAWVAVGLLQLGDATVLPRVEAALATDDWDYDPRGIRSVLRAIKPWVQFAFTTAMTGGFSALSSSDQLRQVSSLIGNAVTSERSRQLKKLDRRRALTARLRWQAADAIAIAQPAESLRLLAPLLDDTTPGVQASAALALARVGDVAALPLLANAYENALGAADTSVRNGPELRATLIRSAVLRAPAAEATRALVVRASSDPDPGVRFIALAAVSGAQQ
jgi:HEAT repeat protein